MFASDGEEEGGINRWSTEDFDGSENTLSNRIMMDICNYTLVRSHKMYITKNER